MKYLLVVPDGVGVRNFLCSRFVDLLLEDGEVVVWHALPDACLGPYLKRWGSAVRFERLPDYSDILLASIIRKARTVAQVRWRQIAGSDQVLMKLRPRGHWKALLLGYISDALARIFATKKGVGGLDWLYDQLTKRRSRLSDFLVFLKHERPQVMFCTHQRSVGAVPAMQAGRILGIPTATFIYSWDNLPKSRNVVNADHFLVWSAEMRDEILFYYPSIQPEQIHVTGTPQFEYYFNSDLVWRREDFLQKHGLDADRPVLCFSGDDITTSPHDPVYLRDLSEALRRYEAGKRPQVLFRRCPVDVSDRYDDVLAQYPEIKLSDPAWSRVRDGAWAEVVPTREDIELLVNVVTHCDLVVNLGSTMGMDFAILDKPAIYLDYDPVSPDDVVRSVKQTYRMPHFRTVHELEPVHWVRSAEMIYGVVRDALEHPSAKSAARRAWLDRNVERPFASASERTANVLKKIAGHPSVGSMKQMVPSSFSKPKVGHIGTSLAAGK